MREKEHLDSPQSSSLHDQAAAPPLAGEAPEVSPPRISVVVPIFNKLPFLAESIGSLRTAVLHYGAAELILIDNGSTDGSLDYISIHFGSAAVVRQLTGATIAAVRNFGAGLGSGTVVCFVDCDCVVPRDHLTKVVQVLTETSADAVGCRVGLPDNPTWVESTWHKIHVDTSDGWRAWINSGNFAIRRQVFDAVGGFDESLITGEDPELCERLRRSGFRLFETRRLLVPHLDNAKTPLAFYRKEVWRGLGMFGTARLAKLDRPIIMTLCHLASFVLAGLLLLLIHAPLIPKIVGALAIVSLVPVITVVYRRRSASMRSSALKGVFLYHLYYLARIEAMFRALGRDA